MFGREPLSPETVLGSFVDGARVRAEALTELADQVGGPDLGTVVRQMLVEHPLPALGTRDSDAVGALRAAYAAQERATVRIAAWLDSAG